MQRGRNEGLAEVMSDIWITCQASEAGRVEGLESSPKGVNVCKGH